MGNSPAQAQTTAQDTPTEQLKRIVREGLCVGCGLCESIAGSDVIQMQTTSINYERPAVIGNLTLEVVERIYDTCPGLRQDTLPAHLIDTDTQVLPVLGPVKKTYVAHASDDKIRIKAASGGVLTALCNYLIDTQQVSLILHATPSKRDVTFGDAHISATTNAVSAGAGSIYGPTAILKNLLALLDRGEPFAIVGKPCDLSGVRNYARYDRRVDSLIKYWLTPICGGSVPSPQLDQFFASKGTNRNDLKWFKYRGDGCPGNTQFETEDGRFVETSMFEPYGGRAEEDWKLPFRCKICPDGPGESADIAAGDLEWKNVPFDKGSNAVVVRTKVGQELWNAAVDAGYLTIEEESTPESIEDFQHHHVKKKMYMRARWDGLAAEGRLRPHADGLRLDEFAAKNADSVNEVQREGTRRRVRDGGADEPVPGE